MNLNPKYQIDQKVKIVRIKQPEWAKKYIGTVTTIKKYVGLLRSNVTGGMYHFYMLDIDVIAHVEEDCIEPYYDGNDPAKWDDCVWKPFDLRVKSVTEKTV